MWDLKPSAPAEIRGPFRPIATTVPGLRVCEHLPRLAHRDALVRSVSDINHNHTPMIYYTLTGRLVDRPDQDNDVRPPQRADFPPSAPCWHGSSAALPACPVTLWSRKWPCAAAPAARTGGCACSCGAAAGSSAFWSIRSASTASQARWRGFRR
jgi:hypothetical protein